MPTRPLAGPLLFLLVGCNSSPPPASPPPGPPQVAVTSPKRQAVGWAVEQPASILAFETTPLVAKLPGYVKELRKDRGDPVEAGEVLAVIDIPELEREADQKKAAVAQAEAEVELDRKAEDVAAEHEATAESMVAEARAGLARAQADHARWESEFKRIEGLVGQRVVDAQTLDETRNQFRSAAAARDETTAKLTTAQSAVRSAKALRAKADADRKTEEAKLKVAEADAKRVAALLAYREVRAPYKGFVTERAVHTGDFLQPGSNRLFTVVHTDTVRVVADVPGAFADQAGPGAKATVRVPDLGGREFAGAVTRTAGVVNPDTRSIRVEVDLPNADGALRPGWYAVVRIAGSATDVLVLPAAALLFADETAYCFAVEGGKVVKLRVQLGASDATGYQVVGKRRAMVAGGEWAPFTGAEKVVVGNLGALADGQPVAVKAD